jgi:hypothetical protein
MLANTRRLIERADGLGAASATAHPVHLLGLGPSAPDYRLPYT